MNILLQCKVFYMIVQLQLICMICLLNLTLVKLKAIFTMISDWFNNINTFYVKSECILLCIGWAANEGKGTRSC